MLRRRIAFILAAVLIVCGLAGCGGTGSEGTGTQKAEGTEPAGGTQNSEERIPLTFLTNVNVDTEGYDINDSPYVKFLEDKFNVDLTIISEASKYPEKVNTIMASGQLPDYMMMMDKASLAKWADEGMLMDITDKIPKYENLSGQISELGWNLCKYEDRVYGVPLLRYDQTPLLTFANKKFLENLDIDPKEVKTIDDWYNMLKRFTFDDPDGNGKQDTYGMMSGEGNFTATTTTFLDAFNGAESQYVNGELIPNFLTEGYKDYLKFMHKLYEDGILDPEFVVTTGQQMWDKAASDKYGTFLWFWMTTELRSKNYDPANLVGLAPPLKADGTQARNKYGSPVRNYTAISKDCKHPEKVLEILDWGCSEEGGVFVFAGIEGLDYEKKGDKIEIKEERRGMNTSLRFILLGTQKPQIDTPLLEDLLSQAFGEASLEFLKQSTEYGMFDEVDLIAPYFPELAMYDLEQPVYEFRDKAIMGTVDIDAEWDNYVSSWRKAGGDVKIRLMTEWYENEYMKDKK
ncbi:extracellular solute-binding protein [Cuneatibacter caecimuris]|uniref:Carbohydrate ABC transporter substrate-binding protein (CUT1 family) n=1 Tax=Cuneatibacter caecimuris TaxID=1796618 RepID=A0A4Q7P481_9FIRM|nr:extracellular solute-binding protein [Cuneatibacter caecimuris]RZS94248.1 carbohydrate ABC transporter substrate-binding protein (CUT1 family) [Cuneatibacter caecimuris]